MPTRIETLNWTTTLIIAAVVAVIFMMKKSGQISAKDALEKLKDGALVIDARSPGEFNSGHLAKAINIPVDEIEMALPKRVKDKKSLAAALPKRNAERRGETEIERHGLRERLQPRLVWPGGKYFETIELVRRRPASFEIQRGEYFRQKANNGWQEPISVETRKLLWMS